MFLFFLLLPHPCQRYSHHHRAACSHVDWWTLLSPSCQTDGQQLDPHEDGWVGAASCLPRPSRKRVECCFVVPRTAEEGGLSGRVTGTEKSFLVLIHRVTADSVLCSLTSAYISIFSCWPLLSSLCSGCCARGCEVYKEVLCLHSVLKGAKTYPM